VQTNPLMKIKRLGQSLWLDYIQRGLLSSGEFQRLIDNDGICGVTSNPAIFEKAMVEHDDYDAAIRDMPGTDANVVYEHLAIADLQQAADLLNPVYESSQGRDGYVSFEVSPQLAYDTDATVAEARRLWAALNRPNSLIKVPATLAGVAAIQQLTAEGININATLLFSLQRYLEVAQAYISGLEMRAAKGEALTSAASVASFFLSRIDTLVDSQLDAVTAGPLQQKAQALRGGAAIASARLAYQDYKRLFSGARWQRLVAAGAQTQRLLWASTSTKDPSYSDIKYVEALIGAETINTLPPDTVAAYRDHGQPEIRLEDDLADAEHALVSLADMELDLNAITDQLEKEGVQKFCTAYGTLFENLQQRIP
jgi:transaldolase